ncbi:MAG: UvrD-helicase domain-containing protein [Verrucomicrobia bacterium]|nr:UvrD-helicase domain-containing protein [Verrucomicrobiota bacterium]
MSREYVLRPFKASRELRIDYAGELNTQQLEAVTAPPGPALVIAGAGSGKTRTLIYRVAYLLEQGIPPERLLLVTFTNKAAREMMRRTGELLGGDLSGLWGGTFHSIGNRILRREGERLGYRRDFTILDREDAKELVQACLDEADIDVRATRFPKADVLGEIYSLAINTNRSVAQVIESQFDYFRGLTASIEEVGRRYAERKRSRGVMDFDDLLMLWLRLLREHADLREQYQRRFQFILVDEYQDTNAVQGEVIDLMAERHRQVMVVGDDSQSIYSWRGADFQNILRFPERYPGARVYRIEANYRSTPEILSLANAAIAANVQQFAKALTAVRRSGTKPVLAPCGDAHEQAAFVAQRILELRDEGVPLEEMAVLYRSHFHALELQLELTRRNIPFSITSGIRFFEQAHIKDVAAYLRLVTNPRDELAFKRLTRMLPGVGGKTADRLWRQYDECGPASGRAVAAGLQACVAMVPKKSEVAWTEFAVVLSQLEAAEVRRQPAAMLSLVLDAGYGDYLKAQYANYRARLEDLEQLTGFARQFGTTEDFLAQLALLTNVEAEEERPANKDTEQLRLSTIHQAKGLEYQVVFVIMLCDGLFPSARSLNSPEGEEEERRLFYVAVTRAKNELYLSYPFLRATARGDGAAMQTVSRFLREIPADLMDEWHLHPDGEAGWRD